MEEFSQAWFLAEFDRIGEAMVRDRIISGRYRDQNNARLYAEEWLRSLEAARASEAFNKRDAREEETLEIARSSSATSAEALSIAREANRIASEDLAVARSSAESARANARWAMYAAIIATVAAVIAAKDQLIAFIFNP